jgi:glucosamine--fructose-6-phosphate aminotransferase (isomerizing)
MCGIVGYIGSQSASDVILEGLSKLEYRGYDSAGISLLVDNELVGEKKKGKLANLEAAIHENPINSTIGIGHTRWATHGEPSDRNSHPHYSMKRSVAVVHNGIIENYHELKDELVAKGYVFTSDTDTEVVAHLIEDMYTGDILETVKLVLKRLRGSYALGILHKDHPEQLICARLDSPLIVGIGENENFIASDVSALLKYTRDVYYLENGDLGVLTRDGITIYDQNGEVTERQKQRVNWSLDEASKGGFPHFMLKEIFEQPECIKKTIDHFVNENGEVEFKELQGLNMDDIKNIYIVACGTAYHAGLQGEFFLKKIANLHPLVEIASEFRYSDPMIDENTLVIIVSQSGETLDSFLSLREAKAKGAKTLAITNVVGSSIAREADYVVYTTAGPEIAVASTKAYTSQVALFLMLALYFGKNKELNQTLLEEFKSIPEKISTLLDKKDEFKSIAEGFKDAKNGFYLGRGLDYKVALEGSLKMKEISYIHTEAFPSGELKHGSIALIEEGTPVVILATQGDLLEKSFSNIKEVKARGGHTLAITPEANESITSIADETIFIPNSSDILAGLLAVIPLQLLSYYVSVAKGLDVDKPRNLAKSVTVE